ncbi:MAG: hypothetical protein ACKOD2_01615, partial [Ilumatobacteraceae bacterium]
MVGCWGYNGFGESGTGNNSAVGNSLATPQISSQNVTAKAISITSFGTCVITLTDQIACWGGYMDGGSFRHLGFSNSSQYAREVLTGSTGATAVAVGSRHGCALFGSSMKCWGLNEYTPSNGAGSLANDSTSASATSFVTSLNAAVSTITFTDPGTKTTADGSFSIIASSSSGVAVELGNDTPDVCTLSGTTVTVITVGTCTITAAQTELTAGGTKWFKPTAVTRNITITAAAPVVSTGAASEVKNKSATVAGTVNASTASSTVVFEYSTSSNFTGSSTVSGGTVTGATAQAVTGSLTGLTPGTKYWFRVKATNSTGPST